jgi:asparagine synthase (glutamine-hydrolysing)
MCNQAETLWLVFNGEIYNHPQLSYELKALGHVYKSECDAETIIHAWAEWGKDCLQKFRGIFSFVIWDSRTSKVFAARDHLGVKPFYYSQDSDSLIIASQPRAILKMKNFSTKVDESSFADYLFFGVVPHDRAAFENVNKLPPGHYLSYENGVLEVNRYWDVSYQPEITDFEEAKYELSTTLEEAVSLQLMSDVPYGTYLSGGIDSSLITAIAASKSDSSLPSLSIGFNEKKLNELPYARLVANYCGTDQREKVLDYSAAMGVVQDMVEIHDEPYALGAALPLIHLARFTQEQNLKVVLAGDGADELFAGYHHYDRIADSLNHSRLCYQPHEAFIHEKGDIRMPGKAVKEALITGSQWRYDKFLGNTGIAVLDTQLLDLRSYLPDEILMKVDRASMAFGVEVRVPFLDQRLVELAFKIDHRLIYKAGERKALLKSVAQDWLPDTVLTQRKKGFSIPMRNWMLRPDNWLRMYSAVRNGALADHNLIDRDAFNRKGFFLPAKWLWKYYVAELWAQRWIDG